MSLAVKNLDYEIGNERILEAHEKLFHLLTKNWRENWRS